MQCPQPTKAAEAEVCDAWYTTDSDSKQELAERIVIPIRQKPSFYPAMATVGCVGHSPLPMWAGKGNLPEPDGKSVKSSAETMLVGNLTVLRLSYQAYSFTCSRPSACQN
jgi:hypothetical protein